MTASKIKALKVRLIPVYREDANSAMLYSAQAFWRSALCFAAKTWRWARRTIRLGRAQKGGDETRFQR